MATKLEVLAAEYRKAWAEWYSWEMLGRKAGYITRMTGRMLDDYRSARLQWQLAQQHLENYIQAEWDGWQTIHLEEEKANA